MAYRTYINDHEWLGNNVMFDNIYKELKRQGCPFKDDDGYIESFQVKDLDALVKACERDIVELRDKWLSNTYKSTDIATANYIFEGHGLYGSDLTLSLNEYQKHAFIFISSNLLEYVGWDNINLGGEVVDGKFINHFTLKEGAKCEFKAF